MFIIVVFPLSRKHYKTLKLTLKSYKLLLYIIPNIDSLDFTLTPHVQIYSPKQGLNYP